MDVFIKNCMYYMKKGSILILTVPAGPMGYYDHHIGHLRHFTKEKIYTLFSKHFCDIEIQATGFPFYNLYRILRMLRGKQMVKDATTIDGKRGLLVKTISFVLRVLIKMFSVKDCKYGWQLICTARKL